MGNTIISNIGPLARYRYRWPDRPHFAILSLKAKIQEGDSFSALDPRRWLKLMQEGKWVRVRVTVIKWEFVVVFGSAFIEKIILKEDP